MLQKMAATTRWGWPGSIRKWTGGGVITWCAYGLRCKLRALRWSDQLYWTLPACVVSSLANREIKLERPHCIYPRVSTDQRRHRVFIFKLLSSTKRYLIFQESRRHGLAQIVDSSKLCFSPGFSPLTAAKWSLFVAVRKEWKEPGILNFLVYPAILKIIVSGQVTLLQAREEASHYLSSNAQPVTLEEAQRWGFTQVCDSNWNRTWVAFKLTSDLPCNLSFYDSD